MAAKRRKTQMAETTTLSPSDVEMVLSDSEKSSPDGETSGDETERSDSDY